MTDLNRPTGGEQRSSLFSLAWRESRSTRRRLLLYMSSISLGVAALVAIDSFAGNINRVGAAVAGAGGDAARRGRVDEVQSDALLHPLAKAGVVMARQTSFASMATASLRGVPGTPLPSSPDSLASSAAPTRTTMSAESTVPVRGAGG